MKKFFICLLSLLVLLTGCTGPVEEASLGFISINIDDSVAIGRNIETKPMDVSCYQVLITNETISKTYDPIVVASSKSYAIVQVDCGHCTVEVEAFNSKIDKIGYGKTDVVVKPGTSIEANVSVKELSGNGKITFDISTVLNDGLRLNVYTALADIEAKKEPFKQVELMAKDDGSGYVGTMELPIGFYFYVFSMKDGTILNSPAVLRMSAGVDYVYNCSLGANGKLDISIDNEIVCTPKLEIHGNAGHYYGGETSSFKAICKGMIPTEYHWYLDDVELNQTGPEIDLTLSVDGVSSIYGKHVLHCVVTDGNSSCSSNEAFVLYDSALEFDKSLMLPDNRWNVSQGYIICRLAENNTLPKYGKPLSRWVACNSKGNLLYTRSGITYFEELDLKDVDMDFLRSKDIGMSVDSIDLWGMNYKEIDKNHVYVRIQDYPWDWRSDAEMWFYWYEDGIWHRSCGVFTVENLIPKEGIPVSSEDPEFMQLKEFLSQVGTISSAMVESAGGKPIETIYGERLNISYIIEFSDIKLPYIKNALEWDENDIDGYQTAIGPKGSDTKMTMNILVYPNGKHITYISYLNTDVYGRTAWMDAGPINIDIKDPFIINGLDIRTGECKDIWYSTYGLNMCMISLDEYPVFGEPLKVWQLFDMDGYPYVDNSTKAEYIEKFTFDESLLPKLKTYESYSSDILSLSGYSYRKPDLDSMYVWLCLYPENFRSYCSIRYCWYENGKWHYSKSMFADENCNLKLWKLINDDSGLYDFPAMGNVARVYQEFIGDVPVDTMYGSPINGTYIIEYDRFDNADLIAALKDNARLITDSYKVRNRIGLLDDNIVVSIEIVDYTEEDQIIDVVYKHEGQWYTSSGYSSDNFKTINGVQISI